MFSFLFVSLSVFLSISPSVCVFLSLSACMNVVDAITPECMKDIQSNWVEVLTMI